MTYLAVVPVIYPLWYKRFIRDCKLTELLVVDNTVHNIGVSAAWNKGARRVLEEQRDWLLILSASMRFGPPGGQDFVDVMKSRSDQLVVEAGRGIGWHCVAMNRRVFEDVGLFDENLFAYHEDLDMSRRISLRYGLEPPYWEKIEDCDISFAGFAHGLELGGAVVDEAGQRRYFRRKWGVDPGQQGGYDKPFGDRELSYWPEPVRV